MIPPNFPSEDKNNNLNNDKLSKDAQNNAPEDLQSNKINNKKQKDIQSDKVKNIDITNIPSAIDTDIAEISKIFKRYDGILERFDKESFERQYQSRRAYDTFKKSFEELQKPHTFYEKITKKLGIFKFMLPKSYEQKYADAFEMLHFYSIVPRQVVFVAFLLFALSIALCFGISVFADTIYAFLIFIFCMLVIWFYLYYPFLQEKRAIQKFNSTAPIALLYIIVYLKNEPVLENALFFTSTRLEGPLAYNLRKLLWDLAYSKYPSLDAALEEYMKKWKKWSPVFVSSLEKVQMSFFESTDSDRIKRYDYIMDSMLQDIHDDTQLFVKGLKTPTNIINMMGIMLPMMVSIMIPMIIMFMPNLIKPGYLTLLYDFILPFFILMVIYVLVSRRPGYGGVISQDLAKFKLSKFQLIIYIAIFFIIASPALVFFAAFYSPLGFHVVKEGDLNLKVSSNGYSFLPSDQVNLTIKGLDSNIMQISNEHLSKENAAKYVIENNTTANKPLITISRCITDNDAYCVSYKLPSQQQTEGLVEEHSFSANITLIDGTTGKITVSYLIKQISILWIFVVITLFIAIVWFIRNILGKIVDVYKKESKNVDIIERELSVSFYQLSTLLLRGLPLETGIQHIVNTTETAEVRVFFDRILKNMTVLKMSFEDALYDSKIGALTYAPSKLIYDLLIIVAKTVDKGSQNLARTLASLSIYLRNMEKINTQIKQEMADTVSSMQINVYMLLPFISATIINFVFLIGTVFNLIMALPELSMADSAEINSMSSFTSVGMFGFKIYGSLPPDLFAAVVGIYFIASIIILSYFTSFIIYGDDILKFAEALKGNILISTIIFLVILFGMGMIFSAISNQLTGVFITSS